MESSKSLFSTESLMNYSMKTFTEILAEEGVEIMEESVVITPPRCDECKAYDERKKSQSMVIMRVIHCDPITLGKPWHTVISRFSSALDKFTQQL